MHRKVITCCHFYYAKRLIGKQLNEDAYNQGLYIIYVINLYSSASFNYEKPSCNNQPGILAIYLAISFSCSTTCALVGLQFLALLKYILALRKSRRCIQILDNCR